jgi:hypothetical protein
LHHKNKKRFFCCKTCQNYYYTRRTKDITNLKRSEYQLRLKLKEVKMLRSRIESLKLKLK